MDNFTCNRASPHCACGSPGCHLHDHCTPSLLGVTISNHELIYISVVVGGNTSRCSQGMTPFGSPSHQVLKSQEGAMRYINVFQTLFQELPSLSPQQVYTLQVCSLLVIPPPIGRTVPQGGFLTDLTELNLLGWADLVQDMVTRTT